MNKIQILGKNITGDYMIQIILLVIFFLFLILMFAPNSITLKVNILADNYFTNITKQDELENSIKIKILNIFTLYNKELFEKDGKKKEETKKNDTLFNKDFVNSVIKRLIKKVKLDKFVLSLGFNLDDPIANSYINASLNTILCMYINSNQRKFNLNNLYYRTYISNNNLLILNFEGIINISLTDTIKVIAKEYFSSKKKTKKKKQNSKNTNKILEHRKGAYYGRTSNR